MSSFGRMNVFIDIIGPVIEKDKDVFSRDTNKIIASVRAYKEDRHGSTYICANSVSLTTNVPSSSVVLTINSVNLSEAVSGIYAQIGAYVRGKSKIS